MARNSLAFVLLFAVVAASGCFEAKTLLTVEKDGSGTLDQVVYYKEIDPAALGFALGGQGGEGGDFDFGEARKPTEAQQMAAARDQAEKSAAEMGEGVRVTSVELLPPRNGRKGIRVSFAFDDINQLRVNPMPGASTGGGFQMGSAPGATGGLPAEGEFGELAAAAGENGAQKIHFEFTSTPQPALTIYTPEMTNPSAGQPATVDPQARQMASMMMRQMFDGMFLEFRVQVQGKVTDTDATYFNRKANVIGLYRMDFGSLVKDQQAFERLISMDPPADAEAAKKQMEDPLLTRFLKLELKDRVNVSFE